MRSLARLVALKARLAILDGKTDEAIHWIQTGLVMGRHAGRGPTLIQALVGVAFDNLMAERIKDLIQAPGTPSLYWALADRPRPFVDMGEALEGERHLLEKDRCAARRRRSPGAASSWNRILDTVRAVGKGDNGHCGPHITRAASRCAPACVLAGTAEGLPGSAASHRVAA